MTRPVIDLRHGSRTLPTGQEVLAGVDLTVDAGESVAIVGRSGSGKSTLLAGLGLLMPFDRGTRYTLSGANVRQLGERKAARLRARSVGFILQNSGLIEHLSALENVRMPLLHSRYLSPRRAAKRAHEALDGLGIAHLARRRPAHLSGGERQRVAIARALVIRPSLILADEPTGALDEETGRVVLDQMLERVHSSDVALVIVTHDPEVAARAHRTYRLMAGNLQLATRSRT